MASITSERNRLAAQMTALLDRTAADEQHNLDDQSTTRLLHAGRALLELADELLG